MQTRSNNLIYPELSYQIVGACIDVFQEIGPGYRESYYQRALATSLKKRGITFQEQVNIPLKFADKTVGMSRLDFLVENKVIVEIKALERFKKEHYRQLKQYLVHFDLPLGLLVRFSDEGATCQRVLRPFVG